MNDEARYQDQPVRRYVITGGRSRPSRGLRPETLLVAASPARPLPVSASSEQRALAGMCRRLLSLAEAAAHLSLPVSVVSVIAADLLDAGYLSARAAAVTAGRPDRALLQEVLNGLRKLA